MASAIESAANRRLPSSGVSERCWPDTVSVGSINQKHANSGKSKDASLTRLINYCGTRFLR